MVKTSRHRERIWALEILYSLDLTDDFQLDKSRKKIESTKYENQLDDTDYYFEKIIKNVLENHNEYDKLINQTAIDWDIKRMAFIDRNILRIAIFELNNQIPVGVAINEAVELAKEYADQKSAQFINGILSKINK